MTSAIGCRLMVNGQRVPDGSPGDSPLDPNALSGLAVTWGRKTTQDQPEAATCVVQLMDVRGGAAFVDAYRVGLPVAVWATTTTYPDPTEPTFVDPTFSGTPDGQVPGNVRTSNVSATAATGEGLRIWPTHPTRNAVVTLSPADRVTGDPDAWDAIPRIGPGQTWTVAATVAVPAFVGVTVQAVVYDAPDDTTPTVVGAPYVLGPDTTPELLGTPVDNLVTFRVSTDLSGWLGVRLTFLPPGPAWDQLPTDLVWDDVPADVTWDDVATSYVRDVTAYAPASGVLREAVVFAGFVTDMTATWDDDAGHALVELTATDFTADMDNRNVGDEPWTVEPMASRFNRVVNLSGAGIETIIDPGVSSQLMSYQDVDSQGAMGLLTDLGQSVDGVVWSAFHATEGAYLWVEDVSARASGMVLTEQDGTVVLVPDTLGGRIELSACDVLLDPVTWVQDTTDVATRVAVGWQEQGVGEDGEPTTTERTYTLVDGSLELIYGVRRVSVSTLLTTQADAAVVAQRIMARSTSTDWRAEAMTWELGDDVLDGPAIERAMSLIDGTSRIGAPLVLTELPDWTPVQGDQAVFLEGGTYTFEDGAWVLDMTVSRATGLGQSVTWDELPADWSWDMFDPGLSWDELRGARVDVSETETP